MRLSLMILNFLHSRSAIVASRSHSITMILQERLSGPPMLLIFLAAGPSAATTALHPELLRSSVLPSGLPDLHSLSLPELPRSTSHIPVRSGLPLSYPADLTVWNASVEVSASSVGLACMALGRFCDRHCRWHPFPSHADSRCYELLM